MLLFGKKTQIRPRPSALLAVVAFFVISSNAFALGLSENLRRLVAQHPELKSAQDNANAAKDRVDEAYGGYYPIVNITAETGQQTISTAGRRAAGQDTSNLFAKSVTLSVTQNLFDGYRTQAATKAAEAASEASISFEQAIEQRLIVEGALVFLNVIRGQ